MELLPLCLDEKKLSLCLILFFGVITRCVVFIGRRFETPVASILLVNETQKMEIIDVPKRRPVNSRRRVISQKPRINHSHHGEGLKFRFTKLMRDHTLRIDIRFTISFDISSIRY